GVEVSDGEKAVTAEIEQLRHAFGLSVQEDHHDHGHHGRVHEICSKVKLTDEQKVALRDAVIEYKKERIQLAAEKKIAGLNYLSAVLKDEAVKADAETAGTALTENATKTSESKVEFANDLLFDILTAE